MSLQPGSRIAASVATLAAVTCCPYGFERVVVRNDHEQAVCDVRVSHYDDTVEVGRLEPGESATAWLQDCVDGGYRVEWRSCAGGSARTITTCQFEIGLLATANETCDGDRGGLCSAAADSPGS